MAIARSSGGVSLNFMGLATTISLLLKTAIPRFTMKQQVKMTTTNTQIRSVLDLGEVKAVDSQFI